MVEFPTSAHPGDPTLPVVDAVEWLPSLGGARLLRVRGRSTTEACPTLVLHADAHEHRLRTRFEPRFTRDADWRGSYLVTPDLIAAGWTAAWLEWPDATRIDLPDVSPSAGAAVADADVLAERRARRTGSAAPEWGGFAAPEEPGPAGLAAPSVDAPATEHAGEIGETSPLDGAEVSEPGLPRSTPLPSPEGAGEPATPARADVPSPEEVAEPTTPDRAVASSPGDAGEPVSPDRPPVGAASPVTLPRGTGAIASPAAAWTALPAGAFAEASHGETEWRARRAALDGELSRAAEAIARARDGERAAKDAVLTALAGARADLRAVRAAREADASSIATLTAQLETERVAHAVARESLGSLADALAAAREALDAGRRELVNARANADDARIHLADARRDAAVARAEAASLRADLEAERTARAAAEDALLAAGESSELMRRVAELDRQAAGVFGDAELEHRARAQAAAAAAAARRPADQTGRLLSDLEAAAAALRNALPTTPADGLQPRPAEGLAPRAAAPADAVAPRPTTPADAAAPRPTPAEAVVAPRPTPADPVEPPSAAPADGLAPRPDVADPPADDLPAAPTPVEVQVIAGLYPRTVVRFPGGKHNATDEARDAVAEHPPALSAADPAAPVPAGDPSPVVADDLSAASADSSSAAAADPSAASADSLSAAAADPSAVAAAEPSTAADESVAAASPAAAEPEAGASAAARVGSRLVLPDSAQPRPLRHAIAELAHDDPVAAGEVLVGLLPAQGSVYAGRVAYDLTIRGVGTFGVTVEGGEAHVQRLTRPRGRRRALFHLAADPLTLAELLAGEERRIGRFTGPARVSRRRRRTRVLKELSLAELSLADAIRAGARLEPALVYCALPFAIDPEWTLGHSFTIAQRITDASNRTWFVSALDGKGLDVTERIPLVPPDATITMSRAAFYRVLRGDAPVETDRPRVHGDRHAVAVLKTWTDRASGVG
jgi:hypothetical protein